MPRRSVADGSTLPIIMKKFPFYFLFFFIFALSNCQSTKEQKQPLETIGRSAADSITASNTESHSALMDLIIGKPKHSIKTIGVLVYDGVNDLDMIGPTYVLSTIMGAEVQLIAAKAGNFKTVKGIEIVPNTVIDSVEQLDILVIPGGFKGTILAAYDDKILDWIRKIDKTTTYTTSVCTGGWILGATGLLSGKKATTNWYEAEKMLAKNGATFIQDRYVQDGKYWTSAGVTAGMDMSLAILRDIWGDRYTQAIMLDMEYDPAPPIVGGTPENTGFITYKMMKMMYDSGVEPLIDSLENNLE